MSREDNFLTEREAALGERVSIRLREDEGYRDLLGILLELDCVEKKDGSRHRFDPEAIAYFRVVVTPA